MLWMGQLLCSSFNCELGSLCWNWFHSSGPICDLLLLLLQLLIGFECGVVVLWDLKCKKADYRYNYDEVSRYFPLSFLVRLIVVPFMFSTYSSCQKMLGCETFCYMWLNSSSNIFSYILNQLITAILGDFAPRASYCNFSVFIGELPYNVGLLFNRFRLTSSWSKEVITFRNSA